jgi:hypothetical protein
MEEEIPAVIFRHVRPQHGRKLELRDEERADEVRLVLAQFPLRHVRDEDAPTRHFVREEELDRQLSALLSPFSLRADWADEMLKMAQRENENAAESSARIVREAQVEIAGVNESINRLVSIYVTKDIERDEFLAQKEELLSKRKRFQERIGKNENGQMPWLEPFTEWINSAKTLGEVALRDSPQEKKAVASKVFGSNLFLDSKKARGCSLKPWSLLSENPSLSRMVRPAGIEPTTTCLEGRCSIQLSYGRSQRNISDGHTPAQAWLSMHSPAV